jgi:uncharacterized membrane protein
MTREKAPARPAAFSTGTYTLSSAEDAAEGPSEDEPNPPRTTWHLSSGILKTADPADNSEVDAARDSLNRRLDVVAGLLSALIGVFIAIALFSQMALLLVPLAPVGLYIGVRSARTTTGPPRGFAYAGILLSASVIALFLYATIRYLVE